MKAFLLNLDKDTDRLVAADQQLKTLGIQYERVSAVYGKSLTQEQLKKYFNPFRARLYKGARSSVGIIGCTLSHLFVYKRMIDENIPVALIMEDDLRLSPGFTAALKYVEENVDLNLRQVILFSDHRGGVHTRISQSDESPQIVEVDSDMCSEAYVITLAAARELYRINFPVVADVDAWGRFRRRGHIRLYHAEPPTVMQNRDDFKTNIEMFAPSSQPVLRLLRKFRRAIEKTLDELIFLITRK